MRSKNWELQMRKEKVAGWSWYTEVKKITLCVDSKKYLRNIHQGLIFLQHIFQSSFLRLFIQIAVICLFAVLNVKCVCRFESMLVSYSTTWNTFSHYFVCIEEIAVKSFSKNIPLVRPFKVQLLRESFSARRYLRFFIIKVCIIALKFLTLMTI